MRYLKKIGIAITAAAVLTTAACSSDSADEPTSTATGAGVAASGATPAPAGTGGTADAGAPDTSISGSITLQTWSLKTGFNDYFTSLLAEFNAAYPNVQVEWIDQPGDGYLDKVLSQAQTNTLPDVINLPPDMAYPLLQNGFLTNIAASDATLSETYVQGALDAYKKPGTDEVYGYPWYLSTQLNYWNTEAFTKYGLDPEKPPTTFDELYDAAMAMATASGGTFPLVSSLPSLDDFAAAGVPITNEDGSQYTFNTPEGVAFLQKYRDMFVAGAIPNDVLSGTYTGNAQLFEQGKVGWTTGGANFPDTIEKDVPSLLPKVTSSPNLGTPPLFVQGVSVSATSAAPEAAMALAKFLTNNTNQTAFAHETAIFPSTLAAADDAFFTESDGTLAGDSKVAAFKELAGAKSFTPLQTTDAMKKKFSAQISLAINGDTDPQTALDEAVEFFNDELANG